ncbi:MAG: carboxypeptidase-like regulatory domain-containing protein, partial [Promethearchaeota archaeon]
KIILNNTNVLPSGELIKNATVTYKWAYGQGELIEDNGFYEVDLVNIPSGTYTITITASAGDDYTFDTYEITLTIGSVTPPDFSMLFIISAGGIVVLVGAFTLYEVRFKYPATVRKSRKIRKKIKKGRKTKPIKEIASREDLIKVHLESNIETIHLDKKTENEIKNK